MADLPRRNAFLWSIPAAAIFLTRIPLGGWPYRDEEWRWAPAHFPLIGAIIGLATGIVYTLLHPLGGPAAALVALAFSLLLTGCFHEDGLADTADALGGGFTREKVFEILKDSRVGSYGAAAIVLSISIRALLIAQIDPATAPFLLMLVGSAARVGPIWQLIVLPYATPQGAKSRDLARARPPQGLVALFWFASLAAGVHAAVGISLLQWIAILGGLLAVTVLLGIYWRQRVGGVTGDFLGATEQVGEVFVLAVLVWGMSLHGG